MTAFQKCENAERPIVGIDPDEQPTPEEALDEGDKEAVAAFMDYMRSDFMKWELEDFILANDQSVTVRAWIKQWSEKVRKGEL